jgi:hypothetical protein
MKKQEKRQRRRKCATHTSDSEEESTHTAKKRRLSEHLCLPWNGKFDVYQANGLLFDVEVRLVSHKVRNLADTNFSSTVSFSMKLRTSVIGGPVRFYDLS